MKISLSNMSINQKMALFAFLLGFIAIFTKDPSKSNIVSIDAKELAVQIQNKNNKIDVTQLAEMIIAKRADFKIIDLRSDSKYREYFIPGAINVQPSDLIKLGMPKSQKILLYSDDNYQTAEAWFLLKTARYNAVYMLDGGLNEWKDKILFPLIGANPTPEQKTAFDKLIEISKFFGGAPRLASGEPGATAMPEAKPMPKVAPPPPTAGGGGGKSKREGC